MSANSQPDRSDSALGDWPQILPKIRPGVAPGCGRGLFAREAIAAGEVLERACTVHIDAAQAPVLDGMLPIGEHYLEHPLAKDEGLLVFGLGSLCNHADDPSADFRFEDGGPLGWIVELHALRDIAAGEEITYRYKCPLWFTPQVGP